jgi:ATPase involved in DNA repair/ATPase family associated with various cellular activities (AAA)
VGSVSPLHQGQNVTDMTDTTDMIEPTANAPTSEAAMAESNEAAATQSTDSTYDLLRGRLRTIAQQVSETSEAFNAKRAEVFASSPLTLAEQDRVRTEVASIPRDAVCVNGLLLFGYNVPQGLATNRSVDDVLSLYRLLPQTDTDWNVERVVNDDAAYFLADPSFQRDFLEIYKYYAEARLLTLTIAGDELLMVFGLGSAESDVRVLRWRLRADDTSYIDAYGEHDRATKAPFDFPWIDTDRGAISDGRWPHLAVQGELFIGLTKGTLDFRVNDAVSGSRTVLSEKVVEVEQEVNELRVRYARLGELILIALLPYRENDERFYVYNRLTREAHRVDAIGRGCHQLPEDQGIVFPGGFHLQNGEHRVFTSDTTGLSLHNSVASPNGEDVLYAYVRPETGSYQLLSYNVVRREMGTPIQCHGYARFPDGMIVTVRDAVEAQRVHTIGIFTSPFCDYDRYVPPVASDSFFGRIGNAELVHGISECLSVGRDGANTPFNSASYEALIGRSSRLLDTYAWLGDANAHGLSGLLVQLRKAAGGILDEFAAVSSAKKDVLARTVDVERALTDLKASAELDQRDVQVFIDLVAGSRVVQGRIAELLETRHVDIPRVEALRVLAEQTTGVLGTRALALLGQKEALLGLTQALDKAETGIGAAATTTQLQAIAGSVDELGNRAVLLTELVGGLESADPPQKTAILSKLADMLARRNAVMAGLDSRRSSLLTGEKSAGFQAAVGVLNQRVTSALLSVKDSTSCDRSSSQLAAELENIELAFGEVGEFAAVLATKRSEITEAFGRKREALVAERSAAIGRLVGSSERVLETAVSRASALGDVAELEGFFAADPLVLRVRKAVDELKALGETARAGELSVALRVARDTARRTLRDRVDLVADGMVRIGKRTFGVNEEPFELRMVQTGAEGSVPASDGGSNVGLAIALTGTDLRLPIRDERLQGFGPLVLQGSASETEWISRSLFLAFEAQRLGIAADGLRTFASERFDDGYELGVHDADAALLQTLCAPIFTGAGATAGFALDGSTRAVAGVWFAALGIRERDDVVRSLRALRALGEGSSRDLVVSSHGPSLLAIADLAGLDIDPGLALDYLSQSNERFAVTQAAADRAAIFAEFLAGAGLDAKSASFAELTRWAQDAELPAKRGGAATKPSVHIAAEMAWKLHVPTVSSVAGLSSVVEATGLLAQHGTIVDSTLRFDAGELYTKYRRYCVNDRRRFGEFLAARREVLETWRATLQVGDLRPKVLSSFVRNRLVDDVYFPLVGENLARQLGENGAAQGMLLLVSPPGYGKTTLIEYVAQLLGMALIRVSGPALGTGVTSLDPAVAPDSASASELEKLNRAFAMGTNTLLYLDDIQHLSPEFLQRFIPLCDATRRIEGVFDGSARTFDLSGRRFAVVMAGNPYTSEGTQFKVPDMLANRADVYNLGEVAGNFADVFAQSYLENAVGGNEVTAPLLARGRNDFDRFLAASRGDHLRSDQLEHPYSAADVSNIIKVLANLVQVRDVLLKVNAAYIRSASMDDALRGEPAFALQGSYRNMSRLAGRVLPAMTTEEVSQLIVDHYQAESQTLGAAAAWNLAKLQEVFGAPSSGAMARINELRDRWRQANVGDNPMQVMAGSLREIAESMRPKTAGESLFGNLP